MSSPDEQLLTFAASRGGQRLDQFLAGAVEGASRGDIQRWIKQDRVAVNARPAAKASLRLTLHDQVTLRRPPRVETLIEPEQVALDVVYEDEHLLVVNKPAGMVVHPAPGHTAGTLVNALLGRNPALAAVGGPERAGVVHRLDRETSGLLLVAKSETAFVRLQRQFKTRKVQKHYLALVEGLPEGETGRVEAPVGRDPTRRQRMAVLSANRGGRRAVTAFHVLDSYVSRLSQQRYEFSLLDIDLLTGRTHQIRVHMAFIKHPVVGDRLYGRRKQRVPCPRQFLHAARLTFTHPLNEVPITVEAPLPADLQAVLDQLQPVRE